MALLYREKAVRPGACGALARARNREHGGKARARNRERVPLETARYNQLRKLNPELEKQAAWEQAIGQIAKERSDLYHGYGIWGPLVLHTCLGGNAKRDFGVYLARFLSPVDPALRGEIPELLSLGPSEAVAAWRSIEADRRGGDIAEWLKTQGNTDEKKHGYRDLRVETTKKEIEARFKAIQTTPWVRAAVHPLDYDGPKRGIRLTFVEDELREDRLPAYATGPWIDIVVDRESTVGDNGEAVLRAIDERLDRFDGLAEVCPDRYVLIVYRERRLCGWARWRAELGVVTEDEAEHNPIMARYVGQKGVPVFKSDGTSRVTTLEAVKVGGKTVKVETLLVPQETVNELRLVHRTYATGALAGYQWNDRARGEGCYWFVEGQPVSWESWLSVIPSYLTPTTPWGPLWGLDKKGRVKARRSALRRREYITVSVPEFQLACLPVPQGERGIRRIPKQPLPKRYCPHCHMRLVPGHPGECISIGCSGNDLMGMLAALIEEEAEPRRDEIDHCGTIYRVMEVIVGMERGAGMLCSAAYTLRDSLQSFALSRGLTPRQERYGIR